MAAVNWLVRAGSRELTLRLKLRRQGVSLGRLGRTEEPQRRLEWLRQRKGGRELTRRSGRRSDRALNVTFRGWVLF